MTIKEARKLLGKEAEDCTDEQIEEFIDTASFLADLAIDSYFKQKKKTDVKALKL